ncbi:MAG: hypothetical protein JSS87_10620 [Acidobacteria bacterium]|nr:hypothetical protein [Acidobacteriota bacterium]
MQLRTFATAVLLVCSLSAHAAKKAPPLQDVLQYPANDTHAQEKVTIAVDPYDTRARADFFRIDYVGHGFLPVRVIIRNDSDKALSLDDARIQLVPAHGERIPAALPSEINRRVFRIKDVGAKHIPGVPIITYHKTPVDKKIADDDKDFGFRSTTVEPHSTLSGFLFYDINDMGDAPLKGAEIYVREIRTMDGKQRLFPFTISLNKYLASKDKETK